MGRLARRLSKILCALSAAGWAVQPAVAGDGNLLYPSVPDVSVTVLPGEQKAEAPQSIVIDRSILDTDYHWIPDITLAGWYFRGELLWRQRDRWEGSGLVVSPAGVISSENLDSGVELGARFVIGKQVGDGTEWELQGWWVDDLTRSQQLSGPFNVNMPVYNHPFSFDDFGTNVSYIDVDYETDTAGLELIKRTWTHPCSAPTDCGSSLRFATEYGIRYLNIDDDFSIYSQYGPAPAATGFQDFDYVTNADNHILAGMLGVVGSYELMPGLEARAFLRTSAGINIIDTDVLLRERTGNTAFSKDRDETEFSYIVETGLYGLWRFHENFEIRAGYELMYLVGYAGGYDQFSFNLAQPGQYDDDNSVIFHGAFLSLGISW